MPYRPLDGVKASPSPSPTRLKLISFLSQAV